MFSGIMEEWRDVHCERMDCCLDADGLPSLLEVLSCILLSKVDVDSLEEEDEGFFDQFHVVFVRMRMIGENDEDSGAPRGDVLCTLICSGRRFAAFNRVHMKCCAEEREIILRHCIIVM